MQQALVEQVFQHHRHPANTVEVGHVKLSAGFHVGDVGHACGDAVEVGQIEFDPHLVGNRQQMQHSIGGAANGIGEGDRVLKCLLREDVVGSKPGAQHVDHRHTCRFSVVHASAIDSGRRCRTRQRKAERLADGAHRVGGEHATTRTLTWACVLLDLEQFFFGDLARRAGADGLEHRRDVERFAIEVAGHGRTVVDEHRRQVEAGDRHHHAGHGLVATAGGNQAVESFAVHDGFDGVGDDLATHERRAHAFVTHRDAVAHGDRAELERHTASTTHAHLRRFGEPPYRHVARRDLVP